MKLRHLGLRAKGRFDEHDLRAWLDRVSLVQPLDEAGEGGDLVSLMTVHGAKGLEFDCVLVCGLEDGLFPLAPRLDHRFRPDPAAQRAAVEEERRLMYVAITRARNELYLAYPLVRMAFEGGMDALQRPSRFLQEIPEDLLDTWNLKAYG